NGRNKAIAFTCNSLDVLRTFDRIVKGYPKFPHSHIQPVLEIHENICTPDCALQLCTCHQFAWPLQQAHQQVPGLRFESHTSAKLSQLVSGGIRLVRIEAVEQGPGR